MTIYVCDDNATQLQYIYSFVTEYLAGKVTEPISDSAFMVSPEALLQQFQDQTFQCHLIVLDIHLESSSGIDLAKQINLIAPQCQIIFLTGYIDYAPMVYEAEHIYFVLKTQLEEMLPKAIDKALNQLFQTQPALTITVYNDKVSIPFRKICYIEKAEHRSIIRTIENSISATISLRQLTAMLPSNFVRCHGSYYINLSFVDFHHNTYFQLQSGAKIPIGRTFQQSAKYAYLKYLSSLL